MIKQIASPHSCDGRTLDGLSALREARAVLDAATIRYALRMTGDNRVHAAKLLGISRASLYRKLKQISHREVCDD
mgnify:CR=1 FL=1